MPDLDFRIHAGERVVKGKTPGSGPKLRTTPDVRLSDRDRVESLEVIFTPGHGPTVRVPTQARGRPIKRSQRALH